jgi:hypothetical protein
MKKILFTLIILFISGSLAARHFSDWRLKEFKNEKIVIQCIGNQLMYVIWKYQIGIPVLNKYEKPISCRSKK